MTNIFKYIAKFPRLKIKDQLMFIETMLLLLIFRLILLTVKFKIIARYLGVHKQESSFEIQENDLLTLKKISWTVITTSRFTPWESKCFVQALTAKLMLKRRGIKSTIYFGLKKDENGKMCAHAWLRSGRINVTGGKNCSDFVVISVFGDI